MFPLFETIAIENGKIKNIALHQARYERSLITYYGKSAVTFFNLLDLIQVPKELHNKLVRCRIDYNAHQIKILYIEYTPKTHRVFKSIVCNEILDLWRKLLVIDASDNAIALQFTQLLYQYFFRYTGNETAQRPRPLGA